MESRSYRRPVANRSPPGSASSHSGGDNIYGNIYEDENVGTSTSQRSGQRGMQARTANRNASRGDEQPLHTNNSSSGTNSSPVRNTSSFRRPHQFNPTPTASSVQTNARSARLPGAHTNVNVPSNTVSSNSNSRNNALTFASRQNRKSKNDAGVESNGSRNIHLRSINGTSDSLQTVIPDRWSCPAPSTAFLEFIEHGPLHLQITSKHTNMVLANRSVPIKHLLQATTQRAKSEHGNNIISIGSIDSINSSGNGSSSIYPSITDTTRITNSLSSSTISGDNDVFYFEVAIYMNNRTSYPDESVYIGLDTQPNISAVEHGASKHPFPILPNRHPGDRSQSIGFSTRGEIFVAGVRQQHISQINFKSGDTLGCGIEILGLRRVFFTHCGRICAVPTNYPGFDISESCVPAVGLVVPRTVPSGGVFFEFRANFGYHGDLIWKGSDRLRLVTHEHHSAGGTEREQGAEGHHQDGNDSQHSTLHAKPLNAICAPAVSTGSIHPEMGATSIEGPVHPRSKETRRNKPKPILFMTEDEMNEVRECATNLMRCCGPNIQTNSTTVEEMLQLCESRSKQVSMAIQKMVEMEQLDGLDDMFHLNEFVQSAVQRANQKLIQGQANRPGNDSPRKPRNPPPRRVSNGGSGVEIAVLVKKKDVFSLICMLRAQNEKRVDAALALMKFARGDGENEQDANKQRNEMLSSGGMHSLLTLFRTRNLPRELKVVTALAVAYLSPSFKTDSLVSGGIGLKIMECLRYLSTSRPVSPNGDEITKDEMFRAASIAVTDFWINDLVPALTDTPRMKNDPNAPMDDRSYRSRNLYSGNRRRRFVGITSSGGELEEDQKSAGMQELLEMTVSLTINMSSDSHDEQCRNYALIENMCTIDAAMPIAVREGLLKILVSWLRSNDTEKIRPAALALRNLTLMEDKYMAGWIHSQIVNEGALREIVQLLRDSKHDVCMAAAQILSSLCVAPHTRVALTQENCAQHLIPLLWDHSSPANHEIAFAAGNALLQLAVGAMTRGKNPSINFDEDFSSSPQDDILDIIIEQGAIPPFVSMARSEQSGRLRLVSIEALRVISEDTNPSRRIRQILLDDKAALALGNVLKWDVDAISSFFDESTGEFIIPSTQDHPGPSLQLAANENTSIEMFHALCALANILEPVQSDSVLTPPRLELGQSRPFNPIDVLQTGCVHIAQSGGLESLLWIASLPFQAKANRSKPVHVTDLVVESCRALASLSPLLLTEHSVFEGYASWACDVLKGLTGILKYRVAAGENSNSVTTRELQFDSLRGIAALAEFEPLKLRIVDELIPHLLQMKNAQGERADDVPNAANQVCLALGFTDTEIVQVAGNEPKLLGDWFCLQRSLVIQAMARQEILRILVQLWRQPLEDLKKRGIIPTKLIREASSQSAGTASSSGSNGGDSGADASESKPLEDLFESIEDDTPSILPENILDHYSVVYGGNSKQHIQTFYDADTTLKSMSGSRGKGDAQKGLLSKHIYPLNGASSEKDWILAHSREIKKSPHYDGEHNLPPDSWQPRIQKLLDCCIPSRLFQRDVLPVWDLRLEASFNFRALVMPQRRYFSFRREGELVVRLCDKHAAAADDSDDVYWSLAFTNSSFAGEFADTVVQALYRCPIVQGISFTRNLEWNAIRADDEEDIDDGSALLANLAASLPPWISSLVFDNTLSKASFDGLIKIFVGMGKLSSYTGKEDVSEPNTSVGQKQGTFRSLAIRNSPHLGDQTILPLFDLIGVPQTGKPILASLRILDLSGNELGDEVCSRLLSLVHQDESGCSLEQLDLANNSIGKGTFVRKVFRKYAKDHRYDLLSGVHTGKQNWCSKLHTLNLASNHLCNGSLSLEVISLLKNSALAFKSLDLSNNGLSDGDFDQILTSSLVTNATLLDLNLSGNNLSSSFIDSTLERLKYSESHYGVAFLRIDGNTPLLSASQKSKLALIGRHARVVTVERLLKEKEQAHRSDRDNVHFGNRAVSFFDRTNNTRENDGRNIAVAGEEAPRLEDAEEASVYSQAELSLSTRESSVGRPLHSQEPSSHENMITVLFSAPLVYQDEDDNLHPFKKLDFKMERELIWGCLKEASRDIELSFDNATHNRLLATMTKRCGCLHYSGHGHENYLPFEDGTGGPHWLQIDFLKQLISDGSQQGGAPFKFVFVSACHSGLAGETFASAGVPHVVCCQQESELKDAAALAFTRQFYLALAVGRTVQEAFDQGCKAVQATPNLKDPEKEMEKFVLLPKKGNHNVPVFNARSVPEWPSRRLKETKSRSQRRLLRGTRSVYFGIARNSELSVRNMMQEDPSPTPPQFFLGREIDMYNVLRLILDRRLVSLLSEPGVGCSSLACAICHYINERRNTIDLIDKIIFVKAKQKRSGGRPGSLLDPFYDKLVEEGLARPLDGDDDIENMIFRCLKNVKAFVVFDGTNHLGGNEEVQDFSLFLSDLFRETQNVRVLLTGHKSLGIASGEHQYPLGPLNFGNTVRLFANLCPHLHTPREREDLFNSIVTDWNKAHLSPTHRELDQRTRHVFGLLGNGVPSRIEKAAYLISREDLTNLQSTGDI